MDNAEINNIIKIMGFKYNKKYDCDDDLKTLRYGKVMIMTDQVKAKLSVPINIVSMRVKVLKFHEDFHITSAI